jgi:hypothetical protein
MKNLKIHILFCLLVIGAAVSSCSKSNNVKPQNTSSLSLLNATWSTSAWGGVANNILAFDIKPDSTNATITQIGNPPFGFVVGETLFTNITATGTGTYSAVGTYTYGTNNSSTSTRSATLTLQNNNTQLTVFYPAINSSFPDLTYVYQKGTIQAF